jgi:hypothetical protein
MTLRDITGRATAQTVSRQLPEFEPTSDHVGFVVDKVELGQVFSEYFGFPCQCPTLIIYHPGLVQ